MPMTKRILMLGCLMWLAAAFSPASAVEKRVALVIGNSTYQHVGKLPNPANDATAIGALLQRSGFEVVETRTDLDFRGMRRAIGDFIDKVRDADIAVVFYAGHGIEMDGTNYLLPVDAQLKRDIDVDYEGIPLDRIMRVLEPAKRLRLVILDACRDNPFTRSMKRTIASRSVGRGLAKVEVISSDTLIAFAAKAGSTAADGYGRNSPFTTALLNNLGTPGLDLRLSLGRVRDEVLKATNGEQEPFVYGSLGGSTVELVPAVQHIVPAPKPAPVAAPSANTMDAERQFYEFAASIGTKEAWNQFLSVYPKSLYAGLARAALHKLEIEESKATRREPETETKKTDTPARRSPPKPSARTEPRQPARGASSSSGGSDSRVVCTRVGGCQEVKPGCRVVYGMEASQTYAAAVVCN